MPSYHKTHVTESKEIPKYICVSLWTVNLMIVQPRGQNLKKLEYS